MAGAAGVMVGIIGTVAVQAATGGSENAAGPTPTAAASATTFTFTGKFQLNGCTNWSNTSGTGCVGIGGYSDVQRTTPVTIYDDKATILGTTTLGVGRYADGGGCEFRLSIAGVPADRPFYSVEVGRRGKIIATADQAKAGQSRLAARAH
jgi:hypothetical protein